METWQHIILALLQGLTEFLPISSSAHLILFPKFFGWDDQGLAFDVAVHIGTLTAVIAYFRHELGVMINDWLKSISTRKQTADSRLAWGVLIATLPVGLCGLLFNDIIETALRSPLIIAGTTIAFGLLLWWATSRSQQRRDEHSLTLRDIMIIGVAQAVALIPGTSRSGITITAGLMLNLTPTAAARFSFLLSIPVIVLAGSYKTLGLINDAANTDWSALLTGATISAISAFLCIHYFLKLLERIGMTPFIIYRLILGVVLLILYL